jgi:predicted glycosyltransferase involved in capsule biosynthesis
MCFDFLCNICVKHFYHSKKNWGRYYDKRTWVFI